MDAANAAVTILASVIGLALTGAGLYFAYNHRRQVQLQITDHRLSAYAGLWSLMRPAAPMKTPDGGSLSADERRHLFDEMTNWYFHEGHGMLLESLTREIYLKAKHNLLCPDDQLEPRVFHGAKKLSDRERGDLSIRQLSLLRSQMKKDIEVYGIPFHKNLSHPDKEFLKLCGANLDRPPWAPPWHRRAIKWVTDPEQRKNADRKENEGDQPTTS
ncbi:MAG TPA: hypothetical protein VN973_11110 [Candidatus Dormibacteraeota bacterium]|nr:hypothetical protein [Candidatus Dormibacteraeota bacterium]